MFQTEIRFKQSFNAFTYNRSNFEQLNNLVNILQISELDTKLSDLSIRIKALLSARHDSLHILIAEQLQVTAILGLGETISEFLDVNDENLDKTPDIIYKKNDIVYFIDPSISKDPTAAYKSKMDKYGPICTYVKEVYNIDCEVMPICPHKTLSDLDQSIPAIIPWPPKETTLSGFLDLYRSIENALRDHYKLVDPSEFDTINSNIELDYNSYQTEFLPESFLKAAIQRSIAGQANLSNNYCEFNTFKGIFYELVDDTQVIDHLKDEPINKANYTTYFAEALEKSNPSEKHYKPSFHIPYCEDVDIGSHLSNFGKLKSVLPVDQYNSLNILKLASNVSGSPVSELISHVLNSYLDALEYPADLTMFTTNTYTGNQEKELELKNTRPKNVSFRNHCINQGFKLRADKPYVTKGGIINTKRPHGTAFEYSKHSGVNYTKNNGPRIYKLPKDCPSNGHIKFQEYFDLVSELILPPLKPDEILTMNPGRDSQSANYIKNMSISEFKKYYNVISKTHCHRMSWHTSLVASSLLHFSMRNTKETEYIAINTGLRNVVHICQGGSQNRGSDEGQPFFTIVVTKANCPFINPVFGNFEKYNVGEFEIVVYKWRRITNTKLSFLSDSYYTTLSTGFDTFLRRKEGQMNREVLKRIYSFRALVSQCITQRLSEMLMDVRYLAMSYISEFSDVSGLISDKFGPRYPNCFTLWLVKTLEAKCDKLIENYNKPGSIIKRTIYYVGNQRRLDSVGGQFNILSLWCDDSLDSLQDWFDDIFVYVHTSKDPASQFHEFKKSLETIIKYQRSYDNMSHNQKHGIYKSAEEIKEWLLNPKNLTGCWTDACYHLGECCSDLNTIQLKRDLNKNMNNEPISSIVSTKACIPEYNLCEEEYQYRKRKEDNDKKIAKLLEDKGLEYEKYVPLLRKLQNVRAGTAVLPDKETGRMKVHDCLNDFLIRYPHCETTLDVANWNLSENESRAIADICIKSQYGAKREFYVVNFGAKCLLRTVENCYKSIAKQLPEEMISCPGDTKLQFMSEISETAIKWSSEPSIPTYYVNGDCTKWSAAETMSSFMAMSDGLERYTGKSVNLHNKACFSSWANKKLNIPTTVLKATKYITETNSYLSNGTTLESTQNFLQGMFNYSSSVKATLATRMAIYLWNERYSNDLLHRLLIKHLEHSDDYVLVIRCSSESVMLKFRVYHKLMQRLVGIRDSSKKTNIQFHIMEFISLFSFNGHMSYPSIKKMKEVGLNIGCEGFQQDVMNIVSRCGESSRLGVPLMSTYIQQRIHSLNLYRAYSLARGMKNEGPYSLDPFNFPTELYGLPDCLPICYINSFCNVNNYRLYISDNNAQHVLKGLYRLSAENSEELEDLVKIRDYQPLFTPNYITFKKKTLIAKIQKRLPVNYRDYLLFRDDRPEYKIMKPNHPIELIHWTQFQYFNKSFAKAYTTPGRPSLMLRLSFYVTGGCVYLPWLENPVTIKNSFKLIMDKLNKYPKSSVEIDQILTGFNPNVELIFNLLQNSSLSLSSFRSNPPIAMKLPQPLKYLNIKNNISDIIQYCISPERFSADKRNFKNPSYIGHDIKLLKSTFNIDPNNLHKYDLIKLLSILKSQITKSKFGIGFSEGSSLSQLHFIKGWFTHGVHPRHRTYFIPSEKIDVKHPVTRELIYERHFGLHANVAQILLENLTLCYYFLVVKNNKPLSVFRKVIKEAAIPGFRSVKDCLYSETFLNSFETSLHHSRMDAFMKAILYNDFTPLQEMAEGKMGISYKFVNKKEEIRRLLNNLDTVNMNIIDELLVIRHSQSIYYAVRVEDEVVILSEVRSLTKVSYVYTSSLMLFGLLSKSDHIIRIKEGPLSFIKSTNIRIVKNSDRLQRVGNVFFMNADDKSECYPFEFVNLNNTGMRKKLNLSGIPVEINPLEASANIGVLRLFRLPLYACSPRVVLELSNFSISGIDLKAILENGVLWHYLTGKTNPEITQNDLTKTYVSETVWGLSDAISCIKSRWDDKIYEYKNYISERMEDVEQVVDEAILDPLEGISIGDFGILDLEDGQEDFFGLECENLDLELSMGYGCGTKINADGIPQEQEATDAAGGYNDLFTLQSSLEEEELGMLDISMDLGVGFDSDSLGEWNVEPTINLTSIPSNDTNEDTHRFSPSSDQFGLNEEELSMALGELTFDIVPKEENVDSFTGEESFPTIDEARFQIWEQEKLIDYDLDEDVYSNISEDSEDSTDNENESLFIQLYSRPRLDPNNYTMSMVMSLPNIQDYILTHFTGLSEMLAYVDRTFVVECLCLIGQLEPLKDRLTKEELFTLNCLETFIRRCIENKWVRGNLTISNINFKIINSKDITLELFTTRNMESSAVKFMEKRPNSRMEYFDNKHYIFMFDDNSKSKAAKVLMNIKTDCAKRIPSKEFKRFVEDLERIANECLDYQD